jgi:hypothetical protein
MHGQPAGIKASMGSEGQKLAREKAALPEPGKTNIIPISAAECNFIFYFSPVFSHLLFSKPL